MFLIFFIESKDGMKSNLVKRNLTLNISNFNNNNTNTVDEPPSKKYRSSNDYNDLFDNTQFEN